MVDGTHGWFGNIWIKKLNTGKITPEELFLNAYAEEINESVKFCTYAKKLHVILDAKY